MDVQLTTQLAGAIALTDFLTVGNYYFEIAITSNDFADWPTIHGFSQFSNGSAINRTYLSGL